MDVGDGFGLSLESLVGLQGNEDAVPYPAVVQNELSGRQLNDLSFNIV